MAVTASACKMLACNSGMLLMRSTGFNASSVITRRPFTGSPLLQVLSRFQSGNGAMPPKLTLGQRFKLAYKKYGRVLIAVHLATSAGWFSSFYLLAQSGIDIPKYLEYAGITNERLHRTLQSSAGSVAVAYLLYKLASPVRYAVTLGGTAVCVNMLRRMGYMTAHHMQAGALAAGAAAKKIQPTQQQPTSTTTTTPKKPENTPPS